MRKVFLIAIHFILLFLFFLISPSGVHPSGGDGNLHQGNPHYSSPWVDSVFASLSMEERIAQLLMVRVHTGRDDHYYDSIVHKVKDYNIGGAAFFSGSPWQQVLLTNRMQSQAKTPLLVAMDAEWGPAMRLDSLVPFPRQMALGAIEDDQLIYQMGMEVGRQLKRLGVHINFAPVVDVNNNPDNPVINKRAFGENQYAVSAKGLAYMHGLQDAGIFACAKHFPGHGDTDADSHHTLPLLSQSFEELDSVHLYPFRQLIDQGLHTVMVAHLEMPSLEPEPALASTLSYNIVTKLLQIKMGFQGLVITDALDMRGVSDFFDSGELELRALMAGNDILLLPEDVPAAINAIKEAIIDGTISEELVNNKCRKILYYKEKAGLFNFRYTPLENLTEELNSTGAKILNKAMVASSLTLVSNEKNLVPLTGLSHRRIAALSIGEYPGNTFHKMLGNYSPVSTYGIDKYHTPERATQIKRKLKAYDLVIISIHDNNFDVTKDYGINGKTIGLINTIAKDQDVILSLFANPYSLNFFGDGILDAEAVLVTYQEGRVYEEAAAQAIFGGLQTRGRLPVTAGKHFPAGHGIVTPEPARIRFGMAEEAGIRSGLLAAIDSIAEQGIRKNAYPGCQIAIIKDGIMIYNKAFGHHTCDSLYRVTAADIYDLASITKIAATTASIMRLYDKGLLEMDQSLSAYLPWLEGTNKEAITLRELMAHQGRLAPWIPFYLETMENGEYLDGIYNSIPTKEFPVRVAKDLFLGKHYRDTIFDRITASDLLENNEYVYSDLGFILLAEIIEEVAGQRIDLFADNFLYRPMGLSTTGFTPADRFDPGRIIPAMNDTLWRRQVVHGHVHDQTAAMLGGVSGHAGLFSNAADLAVLMHVFLNEGRYGGQQFFDQNTINEFTRLQFPDNDNRRGLGFDKPLPDKTENGPSAISASHLSFGHSGFTGTLAWADPVENLVYVFLSNRTYPDQDNNKLIEMNIRTEIHQAIYDAIYYSTTLEHFTTSTMLNQ